MMSACPHLRWKGTKRAFRPQVRAATCHCLPQPQPAAGTHALVGLDGGTRKTDEQKRAGVHLPVVAEVDGLPRWCYSMPWEGTGNNGASTLGLSCPSQPLAHARALVLPRAEQPIPTPSFAQLLTSEPPTSSYLQAANGGQTAVTPGSVRSQSNEALGIKRWVTRGDAEKSRRLALADAYASRSS